MRKFLMVTLLALVFSAPGYAQDNATAIITGTTTVTTVVTGVIEEGRSLPRLNAFESIISTAGGQHGADWSLQFSSHPYRADRA
jgi:hypothetical protein